MIPGLRACYSTSLLRAIFAHARDLDAKTAFPCCVHSIWSARSPATDILELKLIEVRRAVIDGATLSAALQSQELFPDLFTDMMAVGEQTGRFAETMQTIADVYERELDRNVDIDLAIDPAGDHRVDRRSWSAWLFTAFCRRYSKMTHSLQFRPH